MVKRLTRDDGEKQTQECGKMQASLPGVKHSDEIFKLGKSDQVAQLQVTKGIEYSEVQKLGSP
jgi:hypothetical protein